MLIFSFIHKVQFIHKNIVVLYRLFPISYSTHILHDHRKKKTLNRRKLLKELLVIGHVAFAVGGDERGKTRKRGIINVFEITGEVREQWKLLVVKRGTGNSD